MCTRMPIIVYYFIGIAQSTSTERMKKIFTSQTFIDVAALEGQQQFFIVNLCLLTYRKYNYSLFLLYKYSHFTLRLWLACSVPLVTAIATAADNIARLFGPCHINFSPNIYCVWLR